MTMIKFKDYPDTTTPIDADNLNNNFDAQLKAFGLYDDTFSETKTYAVGDIEVYEHTLWEFIADKAVGPWDETKVVICPLYVSDDE